MGLNVFLILVSIYWVDFVDDYNIISVVVLFHKLRKLQNLSKFAEKIFFFVIEKL